MARRRRPSESIEVHVRGPVSGQIAAGTHIRQRQAIGAKTEDVTPEALAELRKALADLRAQIESGAPADTRAAALERADELAEAAESQPPDVSTMGYVRGWFTKHVPDLAGAVTMVLSHPTVMKLAQAAGNDVASELERRLSQG